MSDEAIREFSVEETHKFFKNKSVIINRTSKGLGWSSAFMSIQALLPYSANFTAIDNILISLVNSGSVRGNITFYESIRGVMAAPGRVSIFPDRLTFNVDLLSKAVTTHLYLRRSFVNEVASDIYDGDPTTIEFVPRLAIFDPFLEQICIAVRESMIDGSSVGGFYVDYMNRAAAAHLIKKHSNIDMREQAVAREGLSGRLVARTREIIEAKLDERLTTTDLASGSGLGAYHFGRLFKQATGMTLYQFVIRCRVDRARHLLADTTKPIIQIAHECGFADQVHLTRSFGRIVGTTPGVFRNERRK